MQIYVAFIFLVSGNKDSVTRIDNLADISFRMLLSLPAPSCYSRKGKDEGKFHRTTGHEGPQGKKM